MERSRKSWRRCQAGNGNFRRKTLQSQRSTGVKRRFESQLNTSDLLNWCITAVGTDSRGRGVHVPTTFFFPVSVSAIISAAGAAVIDSPTSVSVSPTRAR